MDMSCGQVRVWDWLAVSATFLIHAITCGVGYSSGIFYFRLRDHFQGSHFATSCIGSVMLAMTSIAGIMSTVVVYKFGYRFCVVVGGVMAAAGFVVSTTADMLHELIFFVSIISGIGFGLALTPSVMVVESLFYKSDIRVIASGIALSGSGLGVVFVPLAVYKLLDATDEWTGTACGLAGFASVIALCGFLFRSHAESCQRRHLVRIFETKLLRSWSFVLLCLSNFVWTFGVSIIYIHLPSFNVSLGLGVDEAVMILGISGVAYFTSRAMFQMLDHSAKLDTLSSSLSTVGLTIILMGLFPELFKHKAGQFGYSIMFGLHCGYWTTFVSATASSVIGDMYLAMGKGFLALSVGLGLGLGAPVAGALLDAFDNYNIIFHLAGACLCFSSLVMLGLSLRGTFYVPGLLQMDDMDCSDVIQNESILLLTTPHEPVSMGEDTETTL